MFTDRRAPPLRYGHAAETDVKICDMVKNRTSGWW